MHTCFVGNNESTKYDDAHQLAESYSGCNIIEAKAKEEELITFESRKYKIKFKTNNTNILYSFNHRISYDVSILRFLFNKVEKSQRIDSIICANDWFYRVIIIHNIQYLSSTAQRTLQRFIKREIDHNIMLICTSTSIEYGVSHFTSYGRTIRCKDDSILTKKLRELNINEIPNWKTNLTNYLNKIFRLKDFNPYLGDVYIQMGYAMWISNIEFSQIGKYVIQTLSSYQMPYEIPWDILENVLKRTNKIDHFLKQKKYNSKIYYQEYFNYLIVLASNL